MNEVIEVEENPASTPLRAKSQNQEEPATNSRHPRSKSKQYS